MLNMEYQNLLLYYTNNYFFNQDADICSIQLLLLILKER